MPSFKFEALDTTGAEVKDSVSALSEEEAQQKIKQMGYFVTKIAVKKQKKAAAEKAKRVNQRWPSLHATVFAPRELRGYYLVALGGRTSRQEATILQRKARKMGLPRDTFIQNYRE